MDQTAGIETAPLRTCFTRRHLLLVARSLADVRTRPFGGVDVVCGAGWSTVARSSPTPGRVLRRCRHGVRCWVVNEKFEMRVFPNIPGRRSEHGGPNTALVLLTKNIGGVVAQDLAAERGVAASRIDRCARGPGRERQGAIALSRRRAAPSRGEPLGREPLHARASLRPRSSSGRPHKEGAEERDRPRRARPCTPRLASFGRHLALELSEHEAVIYGWLAPPATG